ncbi:DUF6179 domain-containing protein [Sedimentibacter saalensis]|uniref:DUF6179 domain-containing protein n=1 Tax=Sedimentibacter saalensis TaxID=130788 RepID=UPI0028968F88|nr:DUF6179 domain-containing protein [Sedimentibacter saalensis]
MNNIEKLIHIDRQKLNEEFYFRSLIEEAASLGMIDEEDVENIQYQCLELLKHRIEKLNQGESSSVRVEIAEKIMTSNLYTVGIWLKTMDNADEAIKEIKKTNISLIYEKGRKRIHTKLNSARHIHMMVLKNLLKTDNYTYNATLNDGINGFFKIYNPDYEAHEIRITADYPLSIPVNNLAGIEFVLKYLENIYYENMFCACFSAEDIEHVMFGYSEDYKHLVINIYEIVLIVAIGCKIAGKKAFDLNIMPVHRKITADKLFLKSEEEIEKIVINASEELEEELNINNIYMKQYIKNSLPKVISSIINAVKLSTFENVFISKKFQELNRKFKFDYGIKMEDELYRSTVQEITQCRYSSDKLLIIKRKIKSMADMEDLLLEDELSENEINAVLQGLDMIETAALARRHDFREENKSDFSIEELKLRNCLENFITMQEENQKRLLLKTMDLMED